MPLLRPLSDRVKGLGQIVVAGFWPKIWEGIKWSAEWIADKMFGEAAFKWLGEAMSPAAQTALDLLSAWGVTAVLLILGLYFFFRTDKNKGLRHADIGLAKISRAANFSASEPEESQDKPSAEGQILAADAPISQWSKCAFPDLQRIEQALYEMHSLTVEALDISRNATFVTANFYTEVYSRRSEMIAEIAACRRALADQISNLSVLSYNKYSLYSDVLTPLLNNLPLSNILREIDTIQRALEGLNDHESNQVVELIRDKINGCVRAIEGERASIAQCRDDLKGQKEAISQFLAKP